MIEFIVRARAAPVTALAFRQAVGSGVGYLADILKHGLFISQGHRDDVVVSLVLEKSRDFSRVVRVRGAQLGTIGGLHEEALLKLIEDALRAAERLGKDETLVDQRGVEVITTSFEQLVKSRAAAGEVFLLDESGEDIRSVTLPQDAVFVLTDHTPMPRNTYKSMARQGVRNLSLGPTLLHASQCVTLVLNETDRQGITG